MSKMTNLWLSGVFKNTPKLVFGRGSAPDPAAGAYGAPPDPYSVGEGEHPFPYTLPPRSLWRLDLGTFGALVVSSPSPPNANSW